MYDHPPMVRRMSDHLLFTIEQREDQFVFREGLNNYLTVPVTRAELRQLGQELISLSEHH